MGVSTNAYLYYGFDFFDVEEPADDVPDWMASESREIDSVIRDRFGGKLPDNIRVSLHGSHDCLIWYVCIKESLKIASRGYPLVIQPSELRDMICWSLDLKEFCNKVGIPWKKPQWVLASWWDGP